MNFMNQLPFMKILPLKCLLKTLIHSFLLTTCKFFFLKITHYTLYGAMSTSVAQILAKTFYNTTGSYLVAYTSFLAIFFKISCITYYRYKGWVGQQQGRQVKKWGVVEGVGGGQSIIASSSLMEGLVHKISRRLFLSAVVMTG